MKITINHSINEQRNQAMKITTKKNQDLKNLKFLLLFKKGFFFLFLRMHFGINIFYSFSCQAFRNINQYHSYLKHGIIKMNTKLNED